MKFALIMFFVALTNVSNAQLTVSSLQTEGLINPIGIEENQPTLSWVINSSERGITQKSYEIKVFNGLVNEFWNSGKIISQESINIKYQGPKVQSSTRYYWQVRVTDSNGNKSAWSPKAFWQTGLMDKSEIKATWIEGKKDIGTLSPIFRKSFNIYKKIESATLYATAHGIYEAFINGKRVGESYFTPGWTSYGTRLQYQAYDVSNLLKEGNNALGAMVANGWYKGTLNWEPRDKIYGDKLGFFSQLNLKYTDGTQEIVTTDKTWKTSTSGVLYAEIYNGETFDANKNLKNWSLPSFDDSKWDNILVANYSLSNLIPTINEPIKKQEIFSVKKAIKTPKGETVMDFGQNLVGWETIKLRGKKGDTVRIYHAEVLDKEGNFYTANLRSAKATSTYVLSGEQEIFEPKFTFYGFRYIKIEGLTMGLDTADIKAVALYSNMPKTGWFTSSNSLVNQLQKNIEWGQKGNFLDIPTDCPQRNERLGWTGDAHAFFRTAVYNRDGKNFFKKWLKDMSADQLKDGRIPWVIPGTLLPDQSASTGWADACTIIPWQHYTAYGDKQILIDQYPSMKAWVNYMKKNSVNYLWNTEKFHFGDWLFYRPDDDKDGIAAITDKYLIAQCFFAHSTQMLLNAAEVLNKKEDVEYYSELLNNIKNAFVKEYTTANGGLVSNTQTAYVLALQFDMLPVSLRQQAAKRLVENINKYTHLTTGFLGTPYICHVLSRFGYTDVAYQLLLRENYPSWLYPVKSGATTIWERWDGQKPDGTFQTDEMNSFNHYAYGAIGDWLYRNAAGIQEGSAGYKEIIVKPHLGGGFTSMKANQITPYGEVSSSWNIIDAKLTLEIKIPANTKAIIYIPFLSKEEIFEGNIQLNKVKNITILGEEANAIKVQVGSGNYKFTSLYK
jgi:alpha-L-rhamnosidase